MHLSVCISDIEGLVASFLMLIRTQFEFRPRVSILDITQGPLLWDKRLIINFSSIIAAVLLCMLLKNFKCVYASKPRGEFANLPSLRDSLIQAITSNA